MGRALDKRQPMACGKNHLLKDRSGGVSREIQKSSGCWEKPSYGGFSSTKKRGVREEGPDVLGAKKTLYFVRSPAHQRKTGIQDEREGTMGHRPLGRKARGRTNRRTKRDQGVNSPCGPLMTRGLGKGQGR